MDLKSIKWDITGTCNLSCIHCCTGNKYAQEKNKELSLKDRLEIIDRFAKGGVTSINLLGGEPLTLGDDFFSIVEYGISKGIQMSSNTNGLLLNNDIIKKLADTGMNGLTISIDGPSSETHDAIRGKDTFKRVVYNVRNLTAYLSKKTNPMNITISTVLNKQNYHNIERMVDLCLNLKVNKWNLLQLGFVGYAKENFNNLALTTEEIINTAIRVAKRVDPYFNDLKDLIVENRFTYLPVCNFINKEYGYKLPMPEVCCTGSLTFGFVDPYGNMFACDRIPSGMYIDSSINTAPIKAMNLLDHAFYDIWNSRYFMEMFPLILDNSTYKNYEPCNHCKYLQIGVCTPCPLNSLRNEKVVIDDCLYVEQKLGNLTSLEEEKQVEDLQQFGESKINIDFREYQCLNDFEFDHQFPIKVNGVRVYKKKETNILFNPYTLDISELNRMGTRIWDMIDGNISIDGIFKTLSDEINSLSVSEELFREKVRYFLYSLKKKELITLSNAGTCLNLCPIGALS